MHTMQNEADIQIMTHLIYPVLILFCATLPVYMYFIRACLCAVDCIN